jgi:desulfoferrodoxin-like iron-binding protein
LFERFAGGINIAFLFDSLIFIKFPEIFTFTKGVDMDLDNTSMSRRDFIGATALGAAVLASGPVFSIAAGEEKKAMAPMNIFVCSKCGHVEFGSAPDFCPVCHASRDQFNQKNVFEEAIANYKDAGISHTPFISVKKKSSVISEMPTHEITVRIGKKLHPMEEAHHIALIDCYVDDKHFARVSLTLGSEPAASFFIKASGSKVRAVEVCSVHGYWQAESSLA